MIRVYALIVSPPFNLPKINANTNEAFRWETSLVFAFDSLPLLVGWCKYPTDVGVMTKF